MDAKGRELRNCMLGLAAILRMDAHECWQPICRLCNGAAVRHFKYPDDIKPGI